MRFFICFVIFFIVGGTSFAEKKSFTKDDYKKFSKQVSTCLGGNNKKCLEKYVLAKMDLIFFEDFGCEKEKLTASEFVKCVYSSKKNYDEYKKMTLKQVLLECFNDPGSKINVNYMNFSSKSGFICSVEIENGQLKIENIMLGD